MYQGKPTLSTVSGPRTQLANTAGKNTVYNMPNKSHHIINSHYIIYAVNIITIEMATNWLGMLILWPQFVQEIYWNSDS